MGELLPCPFCGGEAKQETYSSCDACGGESNSIVCQDCGNRTICCSPLDEAIEAWNTRQNGKDRPEGCQHEWVKIDNPSVHNHTGTFCHICGAIPE